jgi:hypothetical protein
LDHSSGPGCKQFESQHSDPAAHIQQRHALERQSPELLEDQACAWVWTLASIAAQIRLGSIRAEYAPVVFTAEAAIHSPLQFL